MQWIREIVTFAHVTARTAQQKRITFTAAAVSYYALLLFVPVVVLGFVVITEFGGETVAAEIQGLADAFLTPEGENFVQRTLTETGGGSGITAVGVGFLFWGSFKLFRGFDIAFSEIYDTTYDKSLKAQILDAFTVAMMMVLATTVTAALGATVTALPAVDFSGPTVVLLQFMLLTAVFLPLYYVFSDVFLTITDILPGVLIASSGWTVLQLTFSAYAQYVSGSLYSVFGGIMILVTWIYIASLLILLGAVVNVVISDRGVGVH